MGGLESVGGYGMAGLDGTGSCGFLGKVEVWKWSNRTWNWAWERLRGAGGIVCLYLGENYGGFGRR